VILIVDDDPAALKSVRRRWRVMATRWRRSPSPTVPCRSSPRKCPTSSCARSDMFGDERVRLPAHLSNTVSGRETPFIFVSALARPEQIVRGLDKGVDDYLTKRWTPACSVRRSAPHLRRAWGGSASGGAGSSTSCTFRPSCGSARSRGSPGPSR